MHYRPPITPNGRFPQSNVYPPVDTTQFSHSVGETQILLKQAEMLLVKLSDKEYAQKIMEQAQEGKQDAVNELIHSIDGINMAIKTEYTPTGVNFHLALPTADNQHAKCCHIEMTLKWGK